ncbi:hypothetical protein [Nocardia terpenica]|uniref:hypothetical protein n=1 Tax=Nocardia terpenica TaxID=455432 RepID=UPI0012FD1443|nr:hypothetical protein [Nocardia terpenica]
MTTPKVDAHPGGSGFQSICGNGESDGFDPLFTIPITSESLSIPDTTHRHRRPNRPRTRQRCQPRARPIRRGSGRAAREKSGGGATGFADDGLGFAHSPVDVIDDRWDCADRGACDAQPTQTGRQLDIADLETIGHLDIAELGQAGDVLDVPIAPAFHPFQDRGVASVLGCTFPGDAGAFGHRTRDR